MQAIKKSP